MSSTISPNLPGLSGFPAKPLLDPAVVQAEEPLRQNYTPLWMVRSAGSTNPLESLGIRMPSANGDVAALLAQVSLSLEVSIGESRKNRDSIALAAVSAALSAFGAQALRQEAENRTKTAEETKATLDALKADAPALATESGRLTGGIQALKDEIQTLEYSLANDQMSDGERADKTARLAAARGELGLAFAARDGVDIQLAGVLVGSLERQVADLEAQVGRLAEGSAESTTLKAELAAKRSELAGARTALAGFEAGPRTETTRDAFSADTRRAVSSNITALERKLVEAGTSEQAAAAAYANAHASALAMAAQMASQSEGDQSADAGRDAGIVRTFEAIAEGLLEADERLKSTLLNASDATDASRERVEQAAAALLAALSGLVSALAAQAGTPAEPMATPPAMVASRVRVNA